MKNRSLDSKDETPVEDRFLTEPLEIIEKEISPFKAFKSGFARDFTFEHVDELEGMLSKLQGGSYKERRDAVRRLHERIREEQPNAELAGRLTSMIGQAVLTSGGSLAIKGLAVLGARFGLVNVANKLVPISRILKNNPTVANLVENISESALNVIGEAKEADKIKEDLVEKPDLLLTSGFTVAPKVLQKVWDVPKGIKNYVKWSERKAAAMGVDPGAIRYVRDNYDFFLPAGKQTTKDQRERLVLDFVEDYVGNVEVLKRRAYNELNNSIPQAHLSKKKLTHAINDSIIDMFKHPDYKGGGEAYKDNPMLKELLNVRNDIAMGPNFFTETQLKRTIITDRLDKLSDWKTGTIRDSTGGLKDTPITSAQRAAARDARKRVDELLKSKNEKYEKHIKEYNEASLALRGDEDEAIPSLIDTLGLKVSKNGDAIVVEPGVIEDVLMDAFFTKGNIGELALKERNEVAGAMRQKKILFDAMIEANRASKRAKAGAKSDFIVQFNDYKRGILQDKFETPEEANKFIDLLAKKIDVDLGGGGDELINTVHDMINKAFRFPSAAAEKLSVPLISNIIIKQKGKFTRGSLIAEAEKAIQEAKKNPSKVIEKFGLDKNYLKLPEFEFLGKKITPGVLKKHPVPQGIRLYQDYNEKPESKGGLQNRPLTEKQNDAQKTFGDLPEMYGAPPKDLSPTPTPTEKLEGLELESQFEPIKPRVTEEEELPNPDEDDRNQREEKVQSFLDQQLGGKKVRQRYD